MKKHNLRLWVVFLVASVIVILAAPKLAIVQENPSRDFVFGQQPQNNKLDNPKIEQALYTMIYPKAMSDLEKAGIIVNSQRRDLSLNDDTVQVVVEATVNPVFLVTEFFPESMLIRNQIDVLGGKYETSYKNLVQARMPLTAIESLAYSDFVKFVRLPLRPVPQGMTAKTSKSSLETISEGVTKTGADIWQALSPYRSTGQRIKIAILELGFANYASLLGSELPSNVTVRSFRADGDIEANDWNGTACAEIVHDMAPDADLLLVNYGTDVESHNATAWIITQNVKIISCSPYWVNAGDGKGTGPLCEDVKLAASNGITWLAVAGDTALNHWEGTYSDYDGDYWHNFSSADEILDFWVPSYTPVYAWLNWDDWGSWNGVNYSGSTQDYDLYLYIWWNNKWNFVDSSFNFQTGSQWPTESIRRWYSTSPTYWGVAIKRWSTSRNCKLELFTWGNSDAIEYNNPSGSLGIPADSSYAIAIGATDWATDAYLSYSSRGPTHDGRTKPDFVSPSGVSTSTYGSSSFIGTEPGPPHFAGAFGLIQDKTRYTLDQIKNMLENRAINLGDPNRFGKGRLSLNKK
jgi:hypothetical protein